MFLFEDFCGSQRAMHHQGECHDGTVLAPAQHPRLAQFIDMFAVGHFALERVQRFLLEHQHRVIAAHRRGNQALDVGGKRRRHDLDAGNHHCPVFHRL